MFILKYKAYLFMLDAEQGREISILTKATPLTRSLEKHTMGETGVKVKVHHHSIQTLRFKLQDFILKRLKSMCLNDCTV